MFYRSTKEGMSNNSKETFPECSPVLADRENTCLRSHKQNTNILRQTTQENQGWQALHHYNVTKCLILGDGIQKLFTTMMHSVKLNISLASKVSWKVFEINAPLKRTQFTQKLIKQ